MHPLNLNNNSDIFSFDVGFGGADAGGRRAVDRRGILMDNKTSISSWQWLHDVSTSAALVKGEDYHFQLDFILNDFNQEAFVLKDPSFFQNGTDDVLICEVCHVQSNLKVEIPARGEIESHHFE